MGAYEAAGTEQPRACTLARPERFTEILVPIRARSASGLDQVRSIVAQAVSASASVSKGEPPTFMAQRL